MPADVDADPHALYEDSPGLESRGRATLDDTEGQASNQSSEASPSTLRESPSSPRQDPEHEHPRIPTTADVEAGEAVTDAPGSTGSSQPDLTEPYGRALERVLTGESRQKKPRLQARLLGRSRKGRTAAASSSSGESQPRRAAKPNGRGGGGTKDETDRLARMPDSEKAKLQPPQPGEERHGIKQRVLHFTPSWFSVTMGTGVITTLLNLLPWPSIHSGLRYPATAFLFADIVIFVLFVSAFVARYCMYPEVLPLTLKHPQQSMFLGTLPMGLITIISGIAQMGTVEFELGIGFVLAASGLWWFATVLSLLTAIGVPFSMMTHQQHRFEGTTAALLLPIVPPITAAATGSVIGEILIERYPTYALTIMMVSYLVLGIGLPIALLILVLYFQRLLLFNSPPRDVIISVFLPLGPCGQGGEALLHLGQVALRLFPRIATEPGSGVAQLMNVGEALYGGGLISALMLFGLGAWWLLIAMLTLAREVKRGRLGFNLGFWGFTFPLASLAICCARLALVLDSMALKVVYTIFVIANVLLWTYVAIPTAKGFWTGRLLHAPCLAELPLKR